MNFPVSETILDAIGVSHPTDWGQFFELMRQAEYQRIRGVTGSDLTDIPVRVILIDEMEEFFLRLRSTPHTRKQ